MDLYFCWKFSFGPPDPFVTKTNPFKGNSNLSISVSWHNKRKSRIYCWITRKISLNYLSFYRALDASNLYVHCSVKPREITYRKQIRGQVRFIVFTSYSRSLIVSGLWNSSFASTAAHCTFLVYLKDSGYRGWFDQYVNKRDVVRTGAEIYTRIFIVS